MDLTSWVCADETLFLLGLGALHVYGEGTNSVEQVLDLTNKGLSFPLELFFWTVPSRNMSDTAADRIELTLAYSDTFRQQPIFALSLSFVLSTCIGVVVGAFIAIFAIRRQTLPMLKAAWIT